MKLADVLALASRDGRVCPRAHAWTRLHDLLPHKRNDGYGFIPPEPPNGQAWAESSDEHKRERLVEHLKWAESHGALKAAHDCLAALREGEWHHVGD